MNFQLILIGLIVLAALICLWLYYIWRHKRINTNVPKEVMEDFYEAERRFTENQKNGIKKSGEQVLNEIARERAARKLAEANESGGISTMDSSDTPGEPAVEDRAVPEQPREQSSVQDGTTQSTNEPISTDGSDKSEPVANIGQPSSTIGTALKRRSKKEITPGVQ